MSHSGFFLQNRQKVYSAMISYGYKQQSVDFLQIDTEQKEQ
jgi:hypothetical protein